jgi:plastocyanin
MRRALLTFGLAAAIAAWPGVGAIAADKSVTSNTSNPGGANEDNFYDPSTVTVNIGDTVHWHNASGKHNVHLANGTKLGGDPVTHSSSTAHWDAQFTFTKAGTFKYWCDEHSDGSVGMVGKVVVKDPNADTTPPKVTNLSAKPASFCTNKSVSCDKRGTKIKFTLSEAAKVTGQIKPEDGGKFKTIFQNKQKPAGKSSINYSGKDKKPGKYVIRVRAKDAAGNTGKYVKTTVKVVKNG